MGVAARHSGGRIAFVTEGGYDLDALDASLHAVLEAVSGGAGEPPAVDGDRSRGRRAVAAARQALARFWRLDG
jgi:acetoin utilization deacetylase AcuC-like enzyme